MITKNDKFCPICSGDLQYRDSVIRFVRTKNRETKCIDVRRLKCLNCGVIHRELPDDVIPYKQYEAEIIFGVIEGLITPEVLGFEDYPCEMTMRRWRTHNLQGLL